MNATGTDDEYSGQLGGRHIITTPTVPTSVSIATRISTPTPVKRIVYAPKVVESLSQASLISIRESSVSSFVLSSQRPAERSTSSWSEVCQAVRNLRPRTILRPVARSAMSRAEHWYGARTASYVKLIPPSPPTPPVSPPPSTATTPDTRPGTKTTRHSTPASATPGGCASPTCVSNSGLDYWLSSGTYIAMLFVSAVVLCSLVVLRAFFQNTCSDLPPTPAPTPVTSCPSTPILAPSLTLLVSSVPRNQPVTPNHLPSPTSPPAVDLGATPRPPRALPVRPFASKRRSLLAASYDSCLRLFKCTLMSVIQTDTTAYHAVRGLGRRVVFETSTDSLVPDFKMFAEAEQRVVNAVRNAQNMVRAIYAEADGGTIEVDVRVILEGLVVDEDEDGGKSVGGVDRHV
ncbi:unnamed protein product [Rhizoctonia solani]|uniref:Uncharacterized protein n=1 Tax=Rhizoctonia solani TaxID=456999 RepID=A0A8H3C5F1_9AGAM|nr:unnamed protein product [Rhizoctonia solani]